MPTLVCKRQVPLSTAYPRRHATAVVVVTVITIVLVFVAGAVFGFPGKEEQVWSGVWDPSLVLAGANINGMDRMHMKRIDAVCGGEGERRGAVIETPFCMYSTVESWFSTG